MQPLALGAVSTRPWVPQEKGAETEKQHVSTQSKSLASSGKIPNVAKSKATARHTPSSRLLRSGPGRTLTTSGTRKPSGTALPGTASASASRIARQGQSRSDRRHAGQQQLRARSEERQEEHHGEANLVVHSRRCDSQVEPRRQRAGGNCFRLLACRQSRTARTHPERPFLGAFSSA
jgi:hypothetical protein